MSDLIKSSGDGVGGGSSGGGSSVASRARDKLPVGVSGDRTSLAQANASGANRGQVQLRGKQPPPQSQRLPNASIIYGVGASILFVLALGLLFNGLWLTSLVVILAAGCFLGFAVHYIRVDSSDRQPYG